MHALLGKFRAIGPYLIDSSPDSAGLDTGVDTVDTLEFFREDQARALGAQ